MTAFDPALVHAVADAISRNDCRRYEPGHEHAGEKCPPAIAALDVAYPLIEAQVRAEVIQDLRAHIHDLARSQDDYSRAKRAGLMQAAYVAGNRTTDADFAAGVTP